MTERRKAIRSRSLLGGVITFNKRASTMDCQVRNISAAGAKLTFTNTAVVPDRFDLVIACKDRSYRARMVWRRPEEAGIAFVGEYNEDVPIPLALAERLRESEVTQLALRRRIAQLSEGTGV